MHFKYVRASFYYAWRAHSSLTAQCWSIKLFLLLNEEIIQLIHRHLSQNSNLSHLNPVPTLNHSYFLSAGFFYISQIVSSYVLQAKNCEYISISRHPDTSLAHRIFHNNLVTTNEQQNCEAPQSSRSLVLPAKGINIGITG